MAFGQQTGPPATAGQVKELLALLQGAGHDDFRDARGPMGFTQRQASGKFTRNEAAALIDQLQSSGSGSNRPSPAVAATPRFGTERPLDRIPAEQLAAELRRRGWTVTAP
jgi:hypothetical protein